MDFSQDVIGMKMVMKLHFRSFLNVQNRRTICIEKKKWFFRFRLGVCELCDFQRKTKKKEILTSSFWFFII